MSLPAASNKLLNGEISEEIRNEINRFESVHPSIYTVYDLIELINNENLQNRLRQQVVSIEDAFVNSQEWTLSRSVIDLKLGIVGSLHSGKTSLVHRYLTGVCTNEESPEGGRFKKEVVIDGQSYLLLIRDEGNSLPDYQFSHWIDGLILVFSLDNQESIETVFNYYEQMDAYRNLGDIPIILVGTQDSINDANPRIISEQEGRQMAKSIPKCTAYYETCSTYGLNVERVFKDACQKIIQQRFKFFSSGLAPNIRKQIATTTPRLNDHCQNNIHQCTSASYYTPVNIPCSGQVLHRSGHQSKMQRSSHYEYCSPSPAHSTSSIASTHSIIALQNMNSSREMHEISKNDLDQSIYNRDELFIDSNIQSSNFVSTTAVNHLQTPLSTPNLHRKNRRISNLFRTRENENHKDINMGIGRAIPVKQGHLYKRSSKTLNKEWKKKYVCLYSDGRLSYHQNLKDYMDKESSSKEIYLGLATVRIIGQQRPRSTQHSLNQLVNNDINVIRRESFEQSDKTLLPVNLPVDFASNKNEERSKKFEECSDDQQILNSQRTNNLIVTPNSAISNKRKKIHRRGASNAKNNDEEIDCEFEVLTCDEKRWEFSAVSVEERDEWVMAIEKIIEKTLQSQMSDKEQKNKRIHSSRNEIQALKEIPGNEICADCGAENPDWASLNLGTLICIQCSGVHRNLGSHISKVRSLDLDDWRIEWLLVMEAIGNRKTNSIWEYNAPVNKKPTADSSYEEKEKWIKMKYEKKSYFNTKSIDSHRSYGIQLLDAVFNNDLNILLPILPLCNENDLRTTVDVNDKRTALHIACSNASAIFTQLLVWYNADIYMLDDMGRSALWHAQTSGAHDCVSILLNAGLDSSYGIPSSNAYSGIVAGGLIVGSLAAREYCHPNDMLKNNDAKLRKYTDKYTNNRLSKSSSQLQQQQQIQQSPSSVLNGFHQRASDAFECLPTSVI